MVNSLRKPACVVTFQDAVNEGAMLQCLCLAHLIESKTKQRPFVLNYRNPYRRAAYDRHPCKETLLGFADRSMRLSPPFDDEIAAANWINENASIVFCGSDEIWKWPFPNCDRRFHCPSPNIYLGCGITVPKIAYSVSIGGSPIDGYPQQFPELLREFAVVTARDDRTLQVARRFCSASKLSDPTLGVELDCVFPGYREAAKAIAPKVPFTFLTDPHIVPENLVRDVAIGEIVTTLPSRYLEIGPQEPPVWAAMHGLAEIVISHRFHSTLMALLHGTPCYIHQQRNKITDFVEMAGLGPQPYRRPPSWTILLERCRAEHLRCMELIFDPNAKWAVR